jgi:voltage-gated sodium channel
MAELPLPAGRPRPTDTLRSRVADWVDSPRVQRWIIALVVANAITLGLETVPEVTARFGSLLQRLDAALLAAFVVELLLKISGQGLRFFRNGWNVFDFVVIGIALVPASGPLSVFRALRVLRVLRLVTAIPKMRFVIESLLRSLPGLGSIGMLLVIVFYVFAVVATTLFGAQFPQWFGTLWGSAFSLFQIMTLEGWADIAREVMQAHPSAWIFFLGFILIATFTVLNFFIALIVKAMDEPAAAGPDPDAPATARDLAALRAEIAALRAALPAAPRPPPPRG